jgi:hypothetical protein
MRRGSLLLLAICGCAVGAGDATPDAGDTSFVGNWIGSLTVTEAGQSATSPANIFVATNSAGQVLIAPLCPDNSSGGIANPTSATTFSFIPTSCPPGGASDCPSAILSFGSGTGSLSNGTFSFTIAASLQGCGQIQPVTLTFTGHR